MATERTNPQATLRIPLVAPYNTREFDPAASTEESSVSGYVGYGIVGLMIVGYPLTSGKDVRYVNMLPIKIENPLTGKPYFYAQKRPGWQLDQTIDATENATAMTIWRGYDGTSRIYGVGTDIFRNSSANNLGTITGAASFITETEINGVANLTIISNDGTGWFYPNGGAMTSISDTDFPAEQTPAKTVVGPMIHMDGYAFVLTEDGYLYNSDQGSLSAWTATNFIKTNAYPDKGIGLARYKNHIIALSTNSIEFFNDVGTTNESPLKRIDSLTLRVGCVNSNSYKNIEDSLVWVATSASGGSSVYLLNGYTPVKISTPNIDTQISLSTASQVSIQVVKIFGRAFAFLLLDTKTYVFSLEENIWHEWSSGYRYWDRMEGASSGGGNIYAISLDTDSDIRGRSWVLDVDTPIYTDNGSVYSGVIVTPKIDFDNNNRKRLQKLTLIGDGYSTENIVNISWTDDDYITFSSGRDVNMSARAVLDSCGIFRRRAFKLISNEANALRLESLELLVTQGVT